MVYGWSIAALIGSALIRYICATARRSLKRSRSWDTCWLLRSRSSKLPGWPYEDERRRPFFPPKVLTDCQLLLVNRRVRGTTKIKSTGGKDRDRDTYDTQRAIACKSELLIVPHIFRTLPSNSSLQRPIDPAVCKAKRRTAWYHLSS
jgi:hypothetical protein